MNILTLTDEYFISQGKHKKCFRHPHFPTRCIKIPYNEAGKIDLNREIFYLTHILKKRGDESGVLPHYYGKIQTNLGEGHVFELIRDYDGKISQSLETILAVTPSLLDIKALHTSLLHLRNQLFDYRVITMSIYPENILYQKTDKKIFRLIFINDMGSASLFPLEYYIAPVAKAKIKRYWNRFIQNTIPKRLPLAIAQQLADLVFPNYTRR